MTFQYHTLIISPEFISDDNAYWLLLSTLYDAPRRKFSRNFIECAIDTPRLKRTRRTRMVQTPATPFPMSDTAISDDATAANKSS